MARAIATIYLDSKDMDQLDDLAKARGVSRSSLVQEAIKLLLAKAA